MLYNKTMTKKSYLIIILILILGFLLRFYLWQTNPITLSGDEADVLYQSYSLLKTGKDYTGHFPFPYLHSLYELRTPILSFILIPFVALFGPTIFTLRLTTALFGLFNLILIFFLAKKLFPNQTKIPYLALWLLSITPWHIHYSRLGFDSVYFLTFILIFTLSFLKLLQKSSNLLTIISVLSFVLTFYTYPTAFVIMPIIFLTLIFSIKSIPIPKALSTSLIKFFIPTTILLFPLVLNILINPSQQRISSINITHNQTLVDKITNDQNFDLQHASINSPKLFHNKLYAFTKEILNQYGQTLSFNLLFLKGDPNPRHSTYRNGLLLLFTFIPLFLTFFINSTPSKKLLLLWLLTFPIASALTINGGINATRNFPLLIPLTLLIANGLNYIHQKAKPFLFLLTFLLSLNLASFIHTYFIHHPFESWRFFGTGFKEINQQLDPSQTYFISLRGNPPIIYYTLYQKIHPALFQKFYHQYQNTTFDQSFTYICLKNLCFFDYPNSIHWTNLPPHTYILTAENDTGPGWKLKTNPPPGWQLIYQVISPDHIPIFYILKKLK